MNTHCAAATASASETSVYAPCPGHEPPEPAWKKSFKEVLPKR
jgi:hypothetical protein